MTETVPFSPTKSLIRPGKALYTGEESGVAQGDGALHGNECVCISSEQVSAILERRMVFDEFLTLSDTAENAYIIGLDFSERLAYRETKTVQLNGGLVSGPERPIQTPSSTLTAGFGRGGFGQLGVGGSINVTG